ncbi:MAG: sigma-70 family RNA polymerase sigma factor [Armatimonadetes bacterium]|nr:sigma-70 family RNA polymerase sigma factor [Armatimonadota bacterium]
MNSTETSPSGAVRTAVAPVMELESDAVLIRRHLSGDRRAFEILFRRYQTPIFNLVSRMVGGEDAHDLTQDVFCNALRALHGFRGEAKLSTWLYSIARNVCLNRLRHNAVIREESLDEMQEGSPASDGLPDLSADVHKIAETRELQQIVGSVLARLPPEQRLLITLRDFEQLSYEEISRITEMSLSNVKSRLHRARMAFKDKFKPYLKLLREG